ncbi:uncharacterized protein H6S33_008096 [Morchella sextelata]|uniref:uncharacterized protein n=1 Tax=Morchella sextelata TaxID=1174677 RepID=UPI001D0521C9|nr:uncharacterized protein H6S33_008096 [Morchella sextelata]KAH0603092.1 hypothetical protein H6S33_008096 [Morchella sextelata]
MSSAEASTPSAESAAQDTPAITQRDICDRMRELHLPSDLTNGGLDMTEAVKLYWDRGEEITHRLNVVYKEVEFVGNEMSGIRAAEARAKWTEEDQNEQIKNLKKEINLIKGELLEVRA